MLGYVAHGCKKCPNGSYVSFDKTPGKSVLDCKACPEGKQSTHLSNCLRNCNLIKEYTNQLAGFVFSNLKSVKKDSYQYTHLIFFRKTVEPRVHTDAAGE